jgi:hypothetical protein
LKILCFRTIDFNMDEERSPMSFGASAEFVQLLDATLEIGTDITG